MNDKRKILELIKNKKISAEEGVRLFQKLTNASVLENSSKNNDNKELYRNDGIECLGFVLDKPCNIEDINLQKINVVEPDDDKVQIIVKAFSLNFGDYLCIKGLYPTMPDYPFIPGFEVSGIVNKVGRNVTRVRAGDEIIALTGDNMGGHSTVINIDENLVVKKPGKVSFEEACSFPIVFLTIYHVFEKIKLEAGEKILIQTAAGGTGLIAVQMAKLANAEIYATVSNDEKSDFLKNIGVNHVINYKKEDFFKRIREMTRDYGVDVVINTLSGDSIQKGIDLLAPDGRYAEIAMTGLKTSEKLDLSGFVNNQVFYSVDLRKFMQNNPQKVTQYLDIMVKYLEEEKIKPTVGKVFKFDELKNAFNYMQDRNNIGKIVISTDSTMKKASENNFEIKKDDNENDLSKDIAVIGIACRFPGAKNKDEFWLNLANGINSITKVPKSRLDINVNNDTDQSNPDKINDNWGGFLDNIEYFDPLFFKMTGKEAELTDPQQRIFLEESWNALEDAGYAINEIEDRNCGVFMGVGASDYMKNASDKTDTTEAQSFWGNESSVLPARISYFLDLKGPAIAINTACSSSLVAIHLACQSIKSGECRMAISGGVFITLSPDFFVLSRNSGMLSKDGKCKTFDDDADGFVPGEGVGVIILKLLDKALKDKDNIYGIIKSSAINQDGKTNGITAPSVRSQTDLEIAVYEKSNINPERISYIEAHGTGTKLGDPIEIEALKKSFEKFTAKKNFCGIGSVKTNIGHTVTAAGVAGVIKVLMALKHKQIPPSLNFNKPNEHINFSDTPFYVVNKLEDWKKKDNKSRICAVSSFGFSGTNAHILIEEASELVNHKPKDNMPYYPVVFSGKTENALKRNIENFYNFISSRNGLSLTDISFTLLVGRMHFTYRAAFIVKNIDELKQDINNILNNENNNNYYCAKNSKHDDKNSTSIIDDNALLDLLNINEKELYRTKLEGLILDYIDGGKINWKILFQGSDYKRISIPTYSFERARYWISRLQPDGIKSNETLIKSGSKEPGNRVFYNCLEWKNEKLKNYDFNDLNERAVIVFGADERIINSLKTSSFSGGQSIFFVKNGGSFEKIRDNIFVINPLDKENFLKLFQSFKNLPVNIIYYFKNHDFSTFSSETITDAFFSIVYLSQALITLKLNKNIIIECIYEEEHGRYHPEYGALEGLCRTISLENPYFIFKQIRIIKNTKSDFSLDAILKDFFDDTVSEIMLNGNERFVRILKSGQMEINEGRRIYKDGGVYAISGGTGRIGLLIAEHIKNKVNAKIIIIGRSDVTPQKDTLIKKLNNDSDNIIFLKCDISNEKNVIGLMKKIRRDYGKIDGIIHCAGVLNDCLFVSINKEQSEKIFAPKVRGLINIDTATKHDNLDFFVAFSSIAGIYGHVNQSSYAYANAFMDHYIFQRNQLVKSGQRRGFSYSINWPFWKDGNMKISEDEQIQLNEKYGLSGLTAEIGVNVLDRIIASDISQAIVLYGKRNHLDMNNESETEISGDLSLSDGKLQPEELLDETEWFLKELIAGEIKIPYEHFSINTKFEDFGIDSIMINNLNNKLEKKLPNISKTLLFEYKTVKELAGYLINNKKDSLLRLFNLNNKKVSAVSLSDNNSRITGSAGQKEIESDKTSADENVRIAIIGLSGRYPKSEDIESYWENLRMGKDCISEIPLERWDYRDYYDPDEEKASEGKLYCKWGGFLEDYDKFDPLFFGISPRDAELIDPQERIFLELSWSAVEDAGYIRKIKGEKAGVFAGVTTNSYQLWGPELWRQGNMSMPSSQPWSIANRVSYVMNLHGPSMPVDTACSSSLTAIHLACESLKKKECNVAIAGGVNLYLHPSKYIGMCQMKMLSPDGRCHSFGEKADGFVPGEGGGAVLLKRLDEAKRDGDHIYGVILSSAVNHGGRTNGFTVPNPGSQAELIRNGISLAGINPRTISYIEAHGTGTSLGDPIEIEGLTNAFRTYTGDSGFCAVGSCKTNIGHLESAAGISGITKILLQFKHKKLAASLNSENLNPGINFSDSPFYVQRELSDWKNPVIEGKTYPLRAGISSFGAGGSNAHIILEEYVKNDDKIQQHMPKQSIIVLSAKNKERLNEYVIEIKKFLENIISCENTAFQNIDVIEKEKYINEGIRAEISKILNIDSSNTDFNESLIEMGFSHEAYMKLLEALKERFKINIDDSDISKFGNFNEITAYVKNKLKNDLIEKDANSGKEKINDEIMLEQIEYVLQVCREHYEERLALIADNMNDCIEKLDSFLNDNLNIRNLFTGNIKNNKNQINKIFDIEEKNELTGSFISKKKYNKLAELWVSGIDVEWSLLYKNKFISKIPLPVYPFAKERYFIDVKENKNACNNIKSFENIMNDTSPFENSDFRQNGKIVLKKVNYLNNDRHLNKNGGEGEVTSYENDVIVKNNLISLDNEFKKSKVKSFDMDNKNMIYSKDNLYDDLKIFLTEILKKILRMQIHEIDEDKPFAELGLDSIVSVELIKKINREFEINVKTSKLYDMSTIKKLTDYIFRDFFHEIESYFMKNKDYSQADIKLETGKNNQSDLILNDIREIEEKTLAHKSYENNKENMKDGIHNSNNESKFINSNPGDIAIIGMSCRFPDANGIDQYWDNLAQGKNSIIEVPPERWDVKKYYDPDKSAINKTYCKWGGFLSDIDKFDPLFFNISPSEAELMDPAQRIFLEESLHALEDAHYPMGKLDGLKCGVYAGVMSSAEYNTMTFNNVSNDDPGITMVGNSNSILAARIAYFLNLKGPALSIDTACSSSLVAIHLSCKSLIEGETDLMIAGGISLYLTEQPFIGMSKAGMLSSDGKCKAFDNKADGFVPGEGIGIVVLKRLKDAVRDNDRIYAVIKCSGINQDGKTNGITAPCAESQTDLIADIYKKSGINPEIIDYVEAHGTGTKLGDPIEFDAITNAFHAFTKKSNYCGIGSVKSNIGHTSAAAGIAGLIKLVLAINNKMIPPTINYAKINEHIDLSNTPFYINSRPMEWKKNAAELRVGAVSSFGFSGTNCHLVVSESGRSLFASSVRKSIDRYYLIPISAKSEWSLAQKIRELKIFLENNPGNKKIHISDIAYTSSLGSTHFNYRICFIVKTANDLLSELNSFDINDSDFIYNNGILDNEKKDTENISLNRFISNPSLENIKEVARLYVNGYDPDWKLFFQDGTTDWINLPLYPFERIRCWLNVKNNYKSADSMNFISATKRIHPLIEKNLSDFQKFKYSTRISGNDFFMKDHRINGKRTCPGAVLLEMARIAGSISNGNDILHVSNIYWLHPLIANDDNSTEINVNLFPDGNTVNYVITNQNEKNIIYSKGQLILKNGDENPCDDIDVSIYLQKCNNKIDGGNLYDIFNSIGLSYGKTFKLIDELYIGKDIALSKITLPEELINDWPKNSIYPGIIDAAIQTVCGLLFNNENNGGMYLPVSVRDFFVKDGLSSEYYAIAELKEEKDNIKYYDIQLTSGNGEVQMRFSGLALKYISLFAEENKFTSSEIQDDELFYIQNTIDIAESRININEAKGIILVINETGEFVNKIRKFLSDNGKNIPEIILLNPSGCYERLNDDHFLMNFKEQANYEKLFDTLKNKNLQPERIIYFQDKNSDKTQNITDILSDVMHPVFLLSKNILKLGIKNNIYIDYFFEDNNNIAALLHEAISGFARTVNLENPGIKYRIFGFSQLAGEKAIESVFSDIKGLSDINNVVIYKENKYYINNFTLLKQKLCDNRIVFKDKGVYLLAGGSGQLGLIFARYIAERSKSKIILLGRSGKKINKELKKNDSQIKFMRCDIINKNDVVNTVKIIREKYGEINGVIQCAGMLKDSLLINKNFEDFLAVCKSKIEGTINIDEATTDEKLDFFILFSSIAGQFGNYGQCDYAYSNSFLNNFADYRNKLSLKNERYGTTISISWPLWNDGGMMVDESVMEWMRNNLGIGALTINEGIKAFEDSITYDNPNFIVLKGNKESVMKIIGRHEGKQNEINNMLLIDDETMVKKTENLLKKIFSEKAKIPEDKINIEKPLELYGFDSLLIMSLNRRLENLFGRISSTLFYEYKTLKELSAFFIASYKEDLLKIFNNETILLRGGISEEKKIVFKQSEKIKSNPFETYSYNNPKIPEDMAIIGVSGRYPKSNDVYEFWKNLEEGIDCIGEIPPERWKWADYYDPDKKSAGKSYCKWGGFLSDIDKFDAPFFNISPREAEFLDPQERLFLETVWHVIEDAGYSPGTLVKNTGVFVGVMYGQYQLFGINNDRVSITPGSSFASIANRISYFFDFNGPSLALDTMCSSSLTAIHLACESIRRNECEMAIAGGVNLILHPSKYIQLCAGQFLSGDGRCKSFGNGGDGYVPGEGAGAVIIKSLAKAINDKDHIYGIIKKTAINHGGKTNGYSVPNPNAQADLIYKAIKESKISCEEIGYIEAHGTGTSLGDPIEITGLKKAFEKFTDKKNYCPIGSLKSNIGHLESAAGIAGITKILMQMKYKKLVPSLHADKLNPLINFEDTPFFVQRKIEEWNMHGKPLIAGISSFGAGGANAHIILEEFVDSDNKQSGIISRKENVFVLSARDSAILNTYASIMRNFLKDAKNREEAEGNLDNILYTLQVGREDMEERLAIVVSGYNDLLEKLNIYCQGGNDNTIVRGNIENRNNEFDDEKINSIIDSKSIKELSHAWVNGVFIDWQKIYDIKPFHYPLPGYPFAKKSYWYFSGNHYREDKSMNIIDSSINKMEFGKTKLKPTKNVDPLKYFSEEKPAIKPVYSEKIIEPINTNIKLIGNNNVSLDQIINNIKKNINKVLFLENSEINENKTFINMGMDSILSVEFVKLLNTDLNLNLKIPDLMEFTSIKMLSGFIYDIKNNEINKDERNKLYIPEISVKSNEVKFNDRIENNDLKISQEVSIQEDDEAIAIVGMSGRYPLSGNLEEFWKNLMENKNCITIIPDNRWKIENYYSPDKNQSTKSYCKWGGFISDVDKFDPLFFNISPREAYTMDPQIRLFLEIAWETIEDAGYSKTELIRLQNQSNRKTGVFVGCMYQQYPWLMEDRLIGSLLSNSSYWSIANRVSHFFNFSGPSFAIDSACSSSLTAVHLACESIRRGECYLALAGGINLNIHPGKYIGLSLAGMISSHDKSSSLGRNDGYIPGEGIGAVLLKSLKNAVKDNDHISAVIKASSINHGGYSEGFTAPNYKNQASLIEEVIKKSKINPESIGYIELSATGSPLGDESEIKALKEVFSKYTSKKNIYPIGTVKSNIGHLEAASGISQLIKVILQLENKTLVPMINYEPLNPEINLDDSPFYIQGRTEEWKNKFYMEKNENKKYPLRAIINSFGAGGSNINMMVEEYFQPVKMENNQDNGISQYIILFSARNKIQLKEIIRKYIDFINSERSINIRDIAYTLQVGREHMEERLALIINSRSDLLEKLELINNDKINIAAAYSGTAYMDNLRQLSVNEADLYFANSDYVKLCEYWTKGYIIEWNKLHQTHIPKKIKLPGYPFAKKSYWISSAYEIHEDKKEENGYQTTAELMEKTKHTVTKIIGEYLDLSDEEFIVDKSLKYYGYSSLSAMKVLNSINEKFECEIPVRDFFALTNINSIVKYLSDNKMIKQSVNSQPDYYDVEKILTELESHKITPEEAVNYKDINNSKGDFK